MKKTKHFCDHCGTEVKCLAGTRGANIGDVVRPDGEKFAYIVSLEIKKEEDEKQS